MTLYTKVHMYKLQLKAWSNYGKWQTLCFCCSNRHYSLHNPLKKLRSAENFRGGGSWRFPGGGEFPPRKHAWLKHYLGWISDWLWSSSTSCNKRQQKWTLH